MELHDYQPTLLISMERPLTFSDEFTPNIDRKYINKNKTNKFPISVVSRCSNYCIKFFGFFLPDIMLLVGWAKGHSPCHVSVHCLLGLSFGTVFPLG